MRLLMVKTLEDNRVCSLSSEEEAETQRRVGAGVLEIFWVCSLEIVCLTIDSQTLCGHCEYPVDSRRLLMSHSALRRAAGGANWRFMSGVCSGLHKLRPSFEGTLLDCL